MQITLNLSKTEASILTEALRDYRQRQRELYARAKQNKDRNPGRFNAKIEAAFVLESQFEDFQ